MDERFPLRAATLVALSFLGLASCAGHRVKNPTSLEVLLAELGVEGPAPYHLQPGDGIEVGLFHMPEQNVVLPIRPDGLISLPLANEVEASGKTPEELRLLLQACYDRELLDPEIAVIVHSFSAYKIHVGGQVQRPGVFELAHERRLLQAIFEAGGATPEADLGNVVVLRQRGPASVAVIPIDLSSYLTGEDLRQNIELWPGDAVFVPRSAIADINLWVEQYIRNNLPFDVGWRLEI